MRTSLLALAPVVLALVVAWLRYDDPWVTRDQQAAQRLAHDQAAEAAALFSDPDWRAVALHRAGDFKQAAAAWSGRSGALAAYNRGGALIFLGRYEEAVQAFDVALTERPGWTEAEENRAVAQARIRTEVALGEASEVGADDIVFSPDMPAGGGEPIEVTSGGELDDESMRALWLRSVQTRPEDFLRSKFAYQLATEKGR